MTNTTRHPHIEKATDEQLTELLHEKQAELREVYLRTHRLLLDNLSGVSFSTDCTDAVTSYAAHGYGYDGWGLAALAAYTRWVSLMFFRGVDLDDPEGLLEGGGKMMRHVKLHSLEQFEAHRSALQGLIERASQLNPD